MTRIVLEGSATSGGERYLLLPFEVPEDCRRIDVSYAFGAELGRGHGDVCEPDILDLGLLDPAYEGLPSKQGFRGWSGGARRAVFIEEQHATPGYLPGDLPAGTWHVILGLARVGAAPCPYRVEIEISVARGPAKPGPGWFRGDLQSHTHHSDAKGSLLDLRQAARQRGLDFLAVTDHNTVSHHRYLAELSEPDLLLLPGMELTSYHGHANVWGVEGWVDFRLGSDADVAEAVAEVHRRGGLFSVNHPKHSPGCIGCDWTFQVPAGADSLEAWQGPWALRNWESLERYDAVLRSGRRLTLVGGSDRHQPGWPDPDPAEFQLGSPTTWLYLTELSREAVLDAIRAGRGFVSATPEGPRLELSVAGMPMGSTLMVGGEAEAHAVRCRVEGAAGETLILVGAAGEVGRFEVTSHEFVVELEATGEALRDWRYLRAEVIAAASLPAIRARVEAFARSRGLPWGLTLDEVFAQPYRLALSNPVYFA